VRFRAQEADPRHRAIWAAHQERLTADNAESCKAKVAFRSHWRFESSFCTPGECHEKGGVEGEVGFFRRNHFVPVPAARDLDELNALLLAGCREDETRMIDGRQQTVGEALAIERDHLLPMPGKASTWWRSASPTWMACGACACGPTRIRRRYGRAPPCRSSWPPRRSRSGIRDAALRVTHARTVVTRRSSSLEHYLDVLERKPGALAGSKPLEQWRQAGRWPTSYDRLWQAMMARQGRQVGTKTMIELLQVGREHGFARLRVAIEAALDQGCTDAAAVRHLLAAETLVHERPAPLVDLGLLIQYDRPLPEVHAYDHLLVVAGAVG
jgi:hypothetical protein